MKHFKTISELDQAEGFPPPENPLFSLNLLTNANRLEKHMEFTWDCYIICFKKLKSGELWYGKTKYDHDKGLMFFTGARAEAETCREGFNIGRARVCDPPSRGFSAGSSLIRRD